jgi:hypothetical protein
MLLLLPRWTGGGLRSTPTLTTTAAFPVLRSGRHPRTSIGACSGFTRVTACVLARPPFQRPLSQGFAVAVTRLPSSGFSAPASYRGVSIELLGRDFHPLERCAVVTHPRSPRRWSRREARCLQEGRSYTEPSYGSVSSSPLIEPDVRISRIRLSDSSPVEAFGHAGLVRHGKPSSEFFEAARAFGLFATSSLVHSSQGTLN